MRKISLCFVAIFLFMAARAQAGTYLEEEQRITGMAGAPAQSIVVKSWFSGDKVKKTMGEAPMAFIIDLKKHSVMVIQDDQQVYWQVPPQMYKQMTQASLQAFGIVQNPDGSYKVPKKIFARTGQKRKIGEWQAYEVKIDTKLANEGKVSMWFSEGLGLSQSDYIDTLRAAVAGKEAGLESFFSEIKALKGYPVLSSATFVVNGQHLSLTQQVKVAKKQKLSPGFFAIPKGYRLIDSPMLGGAPQNQSPAPRPQPTPGSAPAQPQTK